MIRAAIIGCGTVGRSWAICFARAGNTVSMYDARAESAEQARAQIALSLERLESRGSIASAATILKRISVASELESTLSGVEYAQESVTENLSIKAEVFAQMDRCAPAGAVLASSTSAIMPSEFLGSVPGRARCLIAHPFNPAHLIPLVEVVPSPWNPADVVDRTVRFLIELGQTPVVIRKEIPGFVGNRLQAAVVNEAMNLVRLGVITPEDLDRCMRDGLGRRWALFGPFETMDLNAPNGFADYAAKFGSSYQELGLTLGVREPWSSEATAQVVAWRRSQAPLKGLAAAQARRDELLSQLAELLERADITVRPP